MNKNKRNISKSAGFCLKHYKPNLALLEMFRNKLAMTSNRGFALVFAIFMVIGLETVIAGSMLGMMRIQREAQRSADEMRLFWFADLMNERTIKLLSDYVTLEKEYPNNLDGNVVIGGVIGDDPVVFAAYLESWFESLKQTYSSALSDISIPAENITITQTVPDPPNDPDRLRNYTIEATAVKTIGADSTPTAMTATITQEVSIPVNKLFEFFIFSATDVELTAGPPFTVQGPIFSNRNVYLMIEPGNTLTLKPADDYDFSGAIPTPEPYIMHAAGNIYFYFKRAVGRNYFLDNPIYADAVPDEYEELGGLELYSGTGFLPPPAPAYTVDLSDPVHDYQDPVPYFYYFKNRPGIGCTKDVNGRWCQNNTILAQTAPGAYDELTSDQYELPSIYPLRFIPDWNHLRFLMDSHDKFYTPASAASGYTSASLSVSSAFNKTDFDSVNLSAECLNENKGCPDPAVNSDQLPIYQSGLVEEGVDEKRLIYSNALEEEHDLIEPVTTDDSPQTVRDKLHGQADAEILICPPDFPVSCPDVVSHPNPDVEVNYTAQDFLTHGILTFPAAADSRGSGIAYQLDIGRMIQELEPIPQKGVPQLIYFHSGESSGENYSLRIVNGSKLPEAGLTIASSGRVWIKGDYNTFDYAKNGDCTELEWDQHDCHVPPAAIFSDSFGVLSNDWDDTWTMDGALDTRQVTNDVMINTALATGFKESYLKEIYANPTEVDLATLQTVTTSSLGGLARPGPNTDGTLLPNHPHPTYLFLCPDKTYLNGRPVYNSGVWTAGATKDCDYYQEKPGIYYLNPHSKRYLIGRAQTPPPTTPSLPCSLEGDVNGDGKVDGDTNGDSKLDSGDEPPAPNTDYALWKEQNGRCYCLNSYSSCKIEDYTCNDPLPWRDATADVNGDARIDGKDKDRIEANLGHTESTHALNCPAGGLDNVRIPIFWDPKTGQRYYNEGKVDTATLKAVPPFPGVWFTTLSGSGLRAVYDCSYELWCPQNPDQNPGNYCTPTADGELCTQCPNGQPAAYHCPDAATYRYQPGVRDGWTDYHELYTPKYSGGIENLINLQEDWTGVTFRFLGTLSFTWPSERLETDYDLFYYAAPERIFDYNEDLRENPPPGTPNLSSVKRLRWSRRF